MSVIDVNVPDATNVAVTRDTLRVELSDGRALSVPWDWFPRLLHAMARERNNWRLIGRAHGIHWEDVDGDISVEGLLAGRASGESQTSLPNGWNNARRDGARRLGVGGLKS
ncbi:DUF2442 domain-containing protein [bacterium]|nr:DUF2442 domain-containing protein [bacterium]